MRCPGCNSSDIRTAESKAVGYFGHKRRRECNDCLHRWTTIEVPVPARRSALRYAQILRKIIPVIDKVLD